MIQAARGDPVLVGAGRGDALDVVGVQTDGLGRLVVRSGRTPELDGDVRRGRDEGVAVLGEDEVVDPVGVCLNLLAELGGRWLIVGRRGVGEGISVVAVPVSQVEMQVPGTYHTIAAARVAVRGQRSGHGKKVGSRPGLTGWSW